MKLENIEDYSDQLFILMSSVFKTICPVLVTFSLKWDLIRFFFSWFRLFLALIELLL